MPIDRRKKSGFGLDLATQLTAWVALGIALGSVIAARYISLENSIKVMPAGILMGFFVIIMVFIKEWHLAAGLLFGIGVLSGFFVVPLNALLQHRGHLLIGAGHSIAVQNFNEQLCILLLGGMYSFSTGMGLSAFGAITAFGLVVAGFMWLIKRWHERNMRDHSEELQKLIEVAKNDHSHG